MQPKNTIRRLLLSLATLLGVTTTAFAWGAAPAFAAAGGSAGAVYTSTNDPAQNQVVMFDRAGDGRLTFAGFIATGGKGAGASLGSQGAVTLSRDGRRLFVVNAGSNSVSSFAVGANGPSLTGVISSGGMMPISVTNHGNLVYVLNAGGAGNISGFTLSPDGRLHPIPGSTRALSSSAAGPAEIAFSPTGTALVVTEKNTNTIDTYSVGADGRAGPRQSNASHGPTPFGFDFDNLGRIFVSEAPLSAVSSYSVSRSGSLRLISGSVADGQQAACWVVVTANGRLAFAANAHNNTISSFTIGPDGSLRLASALAAAGLPAGNIDLALSVDSQYLYQLSGAGRAITGFGVSSGGQLAPAGSPVYLTAPALAGLAAR